jgi:hypothetical protein
MRSGLKVPRSRGYVCFGGAPPAGDWQTQNNRVLAWGLIQHYRLPILRLPTHSCSWPSTVTRRTRRKFPGKHQMGPGPESCDLGKAKRFRELASQLTGLDRD